VTLGLAHERLHEHAGEQPERRVPEEQAPVVGIASNDVMSMGDIVMPSDYVTLWEALTSITSPEVQHWRIV
jgi:hypothetical protein